MRITRVLTGEQFSAMNDQAVADGYWRDDPRVFVPGTAWFMPWVYDPTGERERAGLHVMVDASRKGVIGYLSEHYWRDWADKRPPICVVCPNGEMWEPDRKSSNGTGWVVTGDLPSITCTPSIVVRGYHGFLRDGVFTPDLEGRGQTGTARPISPSRRDLAA